MPPKRATYGTSAAKKAVWTKAKTIKGKNPNAYRKDPYGNVMVASNYGKTSSTGWQIDHIKPKSRGGSNDIRNLQALNSTVNMSKGNTLVKKNRHNN